MSPAVSPTNSSNGEEAAGHIRVLFMANMYPSEAEPGYGSFIARQERRLSCEYGLSFKRVVSTRRGGSLSNAAKYAELAWATVAATAAGGFDLVHAHYLLPVAALSLIPAVVRRTPLVITAHGTDIYSGRRRFWKPWIARALRRACRVITVSEFLAGELTEGFGVTLRRDPVIANMGVDTTLFTPGDTNQAKTERGLPPTTPHLVFVGNFVEQKGVVDLAHALVLLHDGGARFRATLLGHGPLSGEVAAIVAPLGNAVRIEPVVPHAQLVGLFRSADLFVLPSRREGVGLLVCLEALSCGVPVAAGRSGGLPEIIRDGENGVLFEPADPKRIADAIRGLLSDPQALAALAANARSSALPFDDRVQAAKVAAIYRECALRDRGS